MMVDERMIGADPVVRVSVDGTNRVDGRELLHAIRAAEASVPVAEVGPAGLSALEPLVAATLDGETAFFERCPIERARTIAADLDDGTLPTDGATAVVEHDPGTATLPIPDEGPLGVGTRAMLRSCYWVAPTSVEDYRAGGSPVTQPLLSGERTRVRVRSPS
jgi:NADH-quinone oxidoreductase subunit F